MTFDGFPDDAFAFYEGLEADNSKAYWTAHKETYDTAVRAPMAALLAELEPEFGPGHVYRPFRDLRFSRDKTPYKDHQGGYVELADAVGYYLQVSAAGLLVAGGWYSAQGQQVARYREAVDGPDGAELERIVGQLPEHGLQLGGDMLKTRPRGTDPDHPRLELLRHRSVTAWRAFEPEPWVHTGAVVDAVRDAWRAATPILDWLAGHVGPGEEPGERRP